MQQCPWLRVCRRELLPWTSIHHAHCCCQPCMHACLRACVRACVRACMLACLRAHMCARACPCVLGAHNCQDSAIQASVQKACVSSLRTRMGARVAACVPDLGSILAHMPVVVDQRKLCILFSADLAACPYAVKITTSCVLLLAVMCAVGEGLYVCAMHACPQWLETGFHRLRTPLSTLSRFARPSRGHRCSKRMGNHYSCREKIRF